MTEMATTVRHRGSVFVRLGIAGLIMPAMFCLVVLVALAVIFLLSRPPLLVGFWVSYALIGLAAAAVLVSAVTALVAARVVHPAGPVGATAPLAALAPLAEPAPDRALTRRERGFRMTSVAVLILSLVTTALAVLAPFPTPCPTGGFSDTFRGSYDTCWTFVHPQGGSITARLDGVRIVGAPHGDLYTWNTGATRLLQPLTLDRYALETALTLDEPAYHDYQGAGLLIWQDAKNFIRFERGDFGSKASEGIGLGFMEAGTYTRVVDTFGLPSQAQEVSLRLERDGDIYTAWWREGTDGAWRPVGSAKIHLTHASVGLAVAVGPSVAQTPIAATFHSFTILTDVSSG
jgi:hypothetical protein